MFIVDEHTSMQRETAAVSPLRPEEADQRQHGLLHLHSRVSQTLTSVNSDICVFTTSGAGGDSYVGGGGVCQFRNAAPGGESMTVRTAETL